MIRVTIWNEFIHEREYEGIREVYPKGIHGCIEEFLSLNDDMQIRCATMDMPEHGLCEEVLRNTDVLIWWAHCAHEEIEEQVAENVAKHVRRGMGFIALHSAHLCKVLRKLLGTSMCLRWKHGDSEKLVCVNPSHPITKGVKASFVLEQEELYGEYFDIPKPDDVLYLGWFAGGEVFRSGCTFTRGLGRIFYFQPGHEEYPIYYHPEIQKIITNAVRWANPTQRLEEDYSCEEVK